MATFDERINFGWQELANAVIERDIKKATKFTMYIRWLNKEKLKPCLPVSAPLSASIDIK